MTLMLDELFDIKDCTNDFGIDCCQNDHNLDDFIVHEHSFASFPIHATIYAYLIICKPVSSMTIKI